MEEPGYPLNTRLGVPKRQSGLFWRRDNILPLPGFELQTIQPIASRYTDYTKLAPKYKPYDSYSVAPSEYFSEARELKECF
jgi:hypothetical protein